MKKCSNNLVFGLYTDRNLCVGLPKTEISQKPQTVNELVKIHPHHTPNKKTPRKNHEVFKLKSQM